MKRGRGRRTIDARTRFSGPLRQIVDDSSGYSPRMNSPSRPAARPSCRSRQLLCCCFVSSLFWVACEEETPASGGRGAPVAGAGASAGAGPLMTPGAGAGGSDGRELPTDGGAATGGETAAGGGAPVDVDEPDVNEPDVDEPGVVEPGEEKPPEELPDEGDDDIGLPCDVANLLRQRCQNCHSDPPVEGALVPLLTYAHLTARSKNDPTMTVLARSLKRIKDSLRPMPPAPANPITVSEMRPLQAWLDAGAPKGHCDEAPPDDPYDASPTCTTGQYWTAFDSGSPWMNPGLPCIKCHRQSPNQAPLFTVAGTVFATAHEPDKCFGVPLATGAQVVITDANGQELPPIRVVSGGNFGAILSGLALPYRAKIVVGDQERVMLTPQTNGDCNACHTQQGTQGARGRLIVPAEARDEPLEP